ncbi:MAG: large-conductance mechanosensitive channel protein MscL [Ignavibacteria bacterium]
MKIISEFREFALKGNALDLAIGVIIGAAFGKIVSSLVNDVLMPPIGALIGGVNFTGLKLVIKDNATLNYGNFLQSTFDFFIIAFCVFIIVKVVNNLKKKAAEKPLKPVEPSAEVRILTEIKEILQNK